MTGTIKTDMKVLSRELTQVGYTKRFDIKYYWDSHGSKHWDFKEPETWQFSEPVKYELYKELREYYYDFLPGKIYTCVVQFLYINGEKVDVQGLYFDFKPLKTKVKIISCFGAG